LCNAREQKSDLEGATLVPKIGSSLGDEIVRKCSWCFIALCCVLGTDPLAAEPVRLTGQAIKATLPGSVLKLDTPLGTVVPISFGGDGFMSGDAGELASYLGSQKDRGRYWLTEDRICYRWFRWFSGEEHCLMIERDGQRIFWKRDDGESGTATLEERRKVSPARATLTAAAKPETAAAKSVKKNSTEHAFSRKARRPATKLADTKVADNAQDEPVLIKPPTLAVRPRKQNTTTVEEELSLSTTPTNPQRSSKLTR
jgi:hypothetical protein